MAQSSDDGDEQFLIDFGSGGNSDEFRRSGWSEPEPRHTWSVGTESTLEFPRPSRAGTYVMVLEVGPFVWKAVIPAQRLTVSINGSEVGDFVVDAVMPLECEIPWSLIQDREWVSVTFRHPDAARPVDVNGVPDHREIALAFETLTLVRRPEPHPLRSAAPSPAGWEDGADQMPDDQLMMRFESIGENCEFGLVQRRCGAEPLGLLRFASAPLPVLLAALNARFEGLGRPDMVNVQVAKTGHEYLVVDRRFGFVYHPWVLVGEADPEEIRQREARRLPFLTRKILEDLEQPNKIFVYHGMRPIPEVLVRRLAAAMRAFGPTTLLWVETADAQHAAGTVELIQPGLLKGYIDRFAPGENAHDLSLDCWLTLCRRANALVKSLPADPAENRQTAAGA